MEQQLWAGLKNPDSHDLLIDDLPLFFFFLLRQIELYFVAVLKEIFFLNSSTNIA